MEAYRIENYKILNIFKRFAPVVERASIDEAYLDITEVVNKKYEEIYLNNDNNNNNNNNNNFNDESDGEFDLQPNIKHKWYGKVIGGEYKVMEEWDIKLMIGSEIIDRVRNTVHIELGYTCSAGISHNKKFAKLISSKNKPNGQTVLSYHGLPHLLSTESFQKLQGFGGKLGEQIISKFGSDIKTLHDVVHKIPYKMLCDSFGIDTAIWIYKVCHGINFDEVKKVDKVKRFGSSKNIRGVFSNQDLMPHLKLCASEILIRIIQDRKQWQRQPQTLILGYRTRMHPSMLQKTLVMPMIPNDNIMNQNGSHKKYIGIMVDQASKLLPKNNDNTVEYLNISLSVGGFTNIPKNNLTKFFNPNINNNNNNNIDSNIFNRNKKSKDMKKKEKVIKKSFMEEFVSKGKRKLENNSKLDNIQHPKKRIKLDIKDIQCNKCQKFICKSNDINKDSLIQIHKDGHIADNLSFKLNGFESIHISTSKKEKSKPKSKLKSKRNQKKKNSSKNNNSGSSILHFFSKKP